MTKMISLAVSVAFVFSNAIVHADISSVTLLSAGNTFSRDAGLDAAVRFNWTINENERLTVDYVLTESQGSLYDWKLPVDALTSAKGRGDNIDALVYVVIHVTRRYDGKSGGRGGFEDRVLSPRDPAEITMRSPYLTVRDPSIFDVADQIEMRAVVALPGGVEVFSNVIKLNAE